MLPIILLEIWKPMKKLQSKLNFIIDQILRTLKADCIFKVAKRKTEEIENLLRDLSSGADAKKTFFTLQKLLQVVFFLNTQDAEYCYDFVAINGMPILVRSILGISGNTLGYGLSCMQCIVEKSSLSYELDENFLVFVVNNISSSSLNICRPVGTILLELISPTKTY